MLSAPLTLPPAVKSTSAGDAHEVCFHLFWFWLVRKPQNWRGQCGGGGQEGPTAKACSVLGTAALEAPPTSQQLSNHPFCSKAANDAIKFIRRTSVDRTIGYSLKEAHGTQATKQPGVKGLKIIPVDFISYLQTKPQVSSEPPPASEDIGRFMPLSGSLRALTPQPLQEFLSALGVRAGDTLLSKYDMTWSAALLRHVVLAVSFVYTKAHIQMFVLGQPQGSGVE